MAPRCKYTLPQGKRLPWLRGTFAYNACITPTQAKKLFGKKPPEPLGCGAFACVYTSPRKGRVVKITTDRSDIEALKRGKGIPFVPKTYGVWALDSPGHHHRGAISPGRGALGPGAPVYPKGPPEVFAIEVERVKPLDRAQKRKWARRLGCVRWHLRNPYGRRTVQSVPPEKRTPQQRVLPGVVTAQTETASAMRQLSRAPKKYYPGLETDCCPKGPRVAREDCIRGVRQIGEAARLLRKRGVDPGDLHAGNVGIGEDGYWKLIDLGQSSLARGYTVPMTTLRGRKR